MFEVHHVSLSVSNSSRSARFYEQLGFMERLRWVAADGSLTIVHLQLDRVILELFAYENPTGAEVDRSLDDDLRHIGIRHFALRTSSITEAWNFVIACGMQPCTEIKEGRTEIKYFFIRDPDGNFIEFVEDHRSFMPQPIGGPP